MTRTTPSWKEKTRRLYSKMKQRGPVGFELPRFRAWLCCEAENPQEPYKEALIWKCAYTGQLLTVSDVSVDHKLALTHVRSTTLDNLCVASERANRQKGALSDYEFRMLLKLVNEHFTIEGRDDLLRRLGAKPVWGRRNGK